MLVPLREAAVETCGGKAAALGAMLRAGLPVPDGFVVPFAAYRSTAGDLVGLDDSDLDHLASALEALGLGPVAVRSSATGEDARHASAAGQYESALGVHGLHEVHEAVRACWASLHSGRAVAYRSHAGQDAWTEDAAMAVVVQRHLDADVSGVMFTRVGPDDTTVIESAWGLGLGVVAGSVTPDTYRVRADGCVTTSPGDKPTRVDRAGGQGTRTREVPDHLRRRPSLDEETARRLAAMGDTVATSLGGPQDVEWAVADGRVWLLQARPVTVVPPADVPEARTPPDSMTLTGTPGSGGTATGVARLVRGPDDFRRVRPGDVLVCPFTDPAWTPLLRVVAAVVTETGGALAHAAIVARECGIPAVVGVPGATAAIVDGAVVTVDGAAGTVRVG